jgi:hypothetical protein
MSQSLAFTSLAASVEPKQLVFAASLTASTERSSSTNLSGHMDFHHNSLNSSTPGSISTDSCCWSHCFSDRIRFVSVEIEHAFVEGLEEAGEIELAQARLRCPFFQLRPA